MTDLAAALLKDVPRINGDRHFLVSDVLAALSRALDPALTEGAGEVLEGVTPGPWVTGTMLPFTVFNPNPKDNDDSGVICDCQEPANARFIAWCREGVPALLAQNAALRAERDALVKDKRWIMEERDRTFALMLARTEAAEAKVEKLQGKIRDWEVRIDDCEWSANTCLTEGIRAEMRAALTTEEGHE